MKNDAQTAQISLPLPSDKDPHLETDLVQLPSAVAASSGLFYHVEDRRNNADRPWGQFNKKVTPEQRRYQFLQLINHYRFQGHQLAKLDPLNLKQLPDLPELHPAFYGLTDTDLSTVIETDFLFLKKGDTTGRDILNRVKETYCGSVGLEYMYISDKSQKRWLQERFESVQSNPTVSSANKKHILERIIAAELLEQYLHAKYPEQKRFSLEGCEALIPMLDHITHQAGSHLIQEIVIGMAHRGRLNVLVNHMGMSPKDLFTIFDGKHPDPRLSQDLKYHLGFSSIAETENGYVTSTLVFNPSHLEMVNPIVAGITRARQQRRGDIQGSKVLPILIHGDAAFAGQGIVMETLNLSQTRGYRTGGTLHIIINNQIGFTASDPRDTRSSVNCTDIAKMLDMPIFHVNGDDPEALLRTTSLALEFRMKFKKDVLIDVVCFRRHGHNEQDEPFVTQPLMYKKIAGHPGIRQLYTDKLILEGVILRNQAEHLTEEYRDFLNTGGFTTKPSVKRTEWLNNDVDWSIYNTKSWTLPANTAIPVKNAKYLTNKLTTVPEGFQLHPLIMEVVNNRKKMGEGEILVDWGLSENLAYASLLENGFGVRISGMDSGRGTFWHRQAIWYDQNKNQIERQSYVPLRNLSPDQPKFTVIDSLLSEEAVLGFEYGYSITEPHQLVVWEAQYGDFVNGAQVIIDQFITTGENKWGYLSGLVIMLPHGYEGVGPEHSSAHLGRFLQLCAEENIQVCFPSTAAQMFHMLRRQMLRPIRKPLIVMTPKSHFHELEESHSSLEDLANGSFRPVIGEIDEIDQNKVKRIVMCSGKVYYDLLKARREHGIQNVALIRIEQLYPFPHQHLETELARYPNAKELVWAQEETKNHGAWYPLQDDLLLHKKQGQTVTYIGRASAAASAICDKKEHQAQQIALINAALTIA